MLPVGPAMPVDPVDPVVPLPPVDPVLPVVPWRPTCPVLPVFPFDPTTPVAHRERLRAVRQSETNLTFSKQLPLTRLLKHYEM